RGGSDPRSLVAAAPSGLRRSSPLGLPGLTPRATRPRPSGARKSDFASDPDESISEHQLQDREAADEEHDEGDRQPVEVAVDEGLGRGAPGPDDPGDEEEAQAPGGDRGEGEDHQ